MALRVTPVPIPNTTVKPYRANGTAGEALWESRLLPGQMNSEGLEFLTFHLYLFMAS